MIETTLKEIILLIKPRRFSDQRGFFAERITVKKYLEMGIDIEFVQDNHSRSRDVGTLRGLHFPGATSRAKQIGTLW